MASVTSDFFDIWTSPDTTQDIIPLPSSDVESSSQKVSFINQSEENVLSACEISSSVQEMGLIGEILNENQFLNYTSRPLPYQHDIYNNLILSSCQSNPNIFWNDTTPAPSVDIQMNTETDNPNTSENEEIIVNVNHEPLVPTTSIAGMDTYGLDDIPTHGVSSSLDEINLDDVFQGWGENMHHLLWKIVNPMVDISTHEQIDEKAIEKLKRSLNGPFPCHQIAYLNSLMPVQVEETIMTRPDTSLAQLLPMPLSKPVTQTENTRHLPRILSLSSKPKPMNSLSPTSSQSLLNSIFMDSNNCYTPMKEMSPSHNQLQNLLSSIDSTKVLPQKKSWETKCDICGLVLLGGRQRFEAHVKNAHELKCICGLDFKFKIKLMNHIKSMATESQNECNPDELVKHHGITPGDKIKPLFECDYCDDIFRNRNAAVKHRNQVHLHFVETTNEEKVLRTCPSGIKKITKSSGKDEKVRKKGERKSKSALAGSVSSNIACTYDEEDHIISESSADIPNSGRKNRKKSQRTNNSKNLNRRSNSKESQSAINCVPNCKVNLNVNSQHAMCGGLVSVNSSVNKQSSAVRDNDQDAQLDHFQSPNSNSFSSSLIFGLNSDTSANSNTIVANINTLAVAPRPAKKPKKMREALRKRLKTTTDRTPEIINMEEINKLFMSNTNKPAEWVHCSHLPHDSALDHSFVL